MAMARVAAMVMPNPRHRTGQGSETPVPGVLATICPDDKKILHGMADAILTVVAT